MTKARINTGFLSLKAKYFPDWDRGNEWQIVFGESHLCPGATGCCDSKAKTIFLSYQDVRDMPECGLRMFLIHEICHDAGGSGHQQKWVDRMNEAASLASEVGESELADMLRWEIFSYSNIMHPTLEGRSPY